MATSCRTSGECSGEEQRPGLRLVANARGDPARRITSGSALVETEAPDQVSITGPSMWSTCCRRGCPPGTLHAEEIAVPADMVEADSRLVGERRPLSLVNRRFDRQLHRASQPLPQPDARERAAANGADRDDDADGSGPGTGGAGRARRDPQRRRPARSNGGATAGRLAFLDAHRTRLMLDGGRVGPATAWREGRASYRVICADTAGGHLRGRPLAGAIDPSRAAAARCSSNAKPRPTRPSSWPASGGPVPVRSGPSGPRR